MQTITQALTTVIWYGTTLSLANAPWKSSALIVRQVNGAGYSSFDPTQQFNSLAQIATGQVLIVESLASAYSVAGGYQLDNGTAQTTPVNPVRLFASFPAGGTSPAPLTLTVADQPGTYNLDPNNVSANVTSLAYTKAGAAVTLPVTLALGDTLIVTGTTVAGTPGSVTLLKQ